MLHLETFHLGVEIVIFVVALTDCEIFAVTLSVWETG